MQALLFPHKGWGRKRLQEKSERWVIVFRSIHEEFYAQWKLLFKIQARTPCRCFSQNCQSLVPPLPHPHPRPCPKHAPLLALNIHWGLDWNLATLWHCRNYVGQGLCSWQRKHSSNSTWVILNESLYLVINFIIIQPLPLTPKFISQSKLAEIH